ncbi:GNAT family N-acetyltransferase [Roseibium aestuarii]|uniref:GNAT family N-acetyltransferase n=1 Tax=Roseibium aestuarii TaxID=2600299 RepID=A0ABW4JZ39_9HYPH|nr:GNAT family N-acetyltransferase [Roseibium aestuarii]
MEHEIVPATHKTLAEIEKWLDEEEATYLAERKAWKAGGCQGNQPAKGFRCNWDSAKRWLSEGHTQIWVLLVDASAVGFLVGKDILEIHPSLRGKGYGRLLAEFMVQKAFDDGFSVLEIGVALSTAEPFWERMGFTIKPDRRGPGGGIFAFRILPRTFPLGDGERVPYAVEFFTENSRYSNPPTPFAVFSGTGERLSDGSIQLPERAYCFWPDEAGHIDYFVRLSLDGKTLLFDKVKYSQSQKCGVEKDKGYTFIVDRITPPK